MNKKKIESEYKEKIKLITDYNKKYYDSSKPLVTDKEYDDLKKQIPNLEFYEPKDFLEIAQIIKSSKFFIGNQSVCYPIAEALKIPRLLEASPEFPVVQPVGKDAFDQIAKYNFSLKAKYLYVTNGLAHYCCTINYENGKMKFLKDIPEKIK